MKSRNYKMAVMALLIIGFTVRLWGLGVIPGGINQDEAYAGYEAYSLLHSGMDSSGYHNPVYFVSWGSGMNVLNSYLMIPFIWMFGLKCWVIRLPQVIIACLTLLVGFLMLKKMFDRKVALIGLFILSISPWHILMARWGLESNLAPGFLLFGLWFFLLGLEKPKYFMLSALMYGLSLYAYATIWPLVPLLILLQIEYCVYHKELKISWEHMISVVILALMAFPLLLFLMVNTGRIEEIRTSLFSVPKLLYMRSGEFSFDNMPGKIYNLYQILTKQSDGLLWNETEPFGLYYKFSIPIILFGICCEAREWFVEYRKQFTYRAFLFIQLFVSLILGVMVYVNVNRINCIHIPLLLFLALGISYILRLFRKEIFITVIAAYSVCFIAFIFYYQSDYASQIGSQFQKGVGECMEVAVQSEKEVYIKDVMYPKILFYDKTSTKQYLDTVQYSNYPSAYLDVISFSKYHFGIDDTAISSQYAYIYKTDSMDSNIFSQAGLTVENNGEYSVAY